MPTNGAAFDAVTFRCQEDFPKLSRETSVGDTILARLRDRDTNLGASFATLSLVSSPCLTP